VLLELGRDDATRVAVEPSGFYRVRPDPGLKDEVEALLGAGSLVLSRSLGPARAD
jgi:hypothetical protein